MNSEETRVSLPLTEAVELFCDLEEFVVSLDRILSRIDYGANSDILLDYLVNRQVFQRLARARELLGDLVESAIGEERVDDLAEGVYRYPGIS